MVLVCTTTGGPVTTVTWEKHNENGDVDDVETGSQVPVLINPNTEEYSHVLAPDLLGDGVYGCSVSNNKPFSAKVLFKVTGKYFYSSSYFIITMSHAAGTDITDLSKISISSNTSNVVAGGVVTFNCFATIPFTTSTDSIQYEWSGPRVNDDSHTEENGHSIFILSSTFLSDAGDSYECRAFTDDQNISTAVEIHLQSNQTLL